MRKVKGWPLAGLLILLVMCLFVGWVERAQTQEKYPIRTIDIIVPFSPGGSTDLSSRIAGAYLSKKWGVSVNVVNKPGGNTVPAGLEVYKAPADGYTLLAEANGTSSMLPLVVKNLPFQVMERSFVAIFLLTPFVMIVPSASPYKTLEDVIVEAKKDPEHFTWTSLGGASTHDATLRQFFKAIGVDVSRTKPIMSQGASQATNLTAGGHVKLGGGSTSGVLPAFKSGMVRPLGITGKTRHPDFPDVPTFEELGYPAVNVIIWNGLSGPPKLPSYIIGTWDKALQEMIKDQEAISKLRNIGSTPFYLNAGETKGLIMKETKEMENLFGLK